MPISPLTLEKEKEQYDDLRATMERNDPDLDGFKEFVSLGPGVEWDNFFRKIDLASKENAEEHSVRDLDKFQLLKDSVQVFLKHKIGYSDLHRVMRRIAK